MVFRWLILTVAVAGLAVSQEHVSLRTEDGAVIAADVYGKGERGVVLAHGGRFVKESWRDQAAALTAAGFRVIAFDFRGFGQSHGPGEANMFTAPMHLDVLSAVRYLRKTGTTRVSLVGGSFGGVACADAAVRAGPGEVDRVVLLAAEPGSQPEKLKGRKLLIIARDDSNGAGPRLPGIRKGWDKVPEPKELIVLDGSAHAQFLFGTDQGERVMREILRFLSAP